jgi:hypothetical protein
VPLIPGATIKQAFQQASSVSYSLIVNEELADNEGNYEAEISHNTDSHREPDNRELR